MHGSRHNIVIYFIINLFCIQNVIESSPVTHKPHSNDSPVVYRRYVRKNPSPYEGDVYMEDVHEIFEIRRRPPMFAMFQDADIDQLIACDFEPQREECKALRQKEQNVEPALPPLPTKRTPTTVSSTTDKAVITNQMPFKPTPAVDLNPPPLNGIDDIPTLPPESEEYIENVKDPADYEEEESETDDVDQQNNEHNEIDNEDGDDY